MTQEALQQIRNVAFNAAGTIDIEYEHPEFGWIPCTVSPDDSATADLHALALGMSPAAYVVPEAPPVTIAQVKAEANRRILAFAPMHKQNNMLASAILLLDMGRENWDESHQAEADAHYAMWEAVDAIRAASQALCAMEVIPQDYADDSHWPAQAWPESA